jgi:hypothetical protein
MKILIKALTNESTILQENPRSRAKQTVKQRVISAIFSAINLSMNSSNKREYSFGYRITKLEESTIRAFAAVYGQFKVMAMQL